MSTTLCKCCTLHLSATDSLLFFSLLHHSTILMQLFLKIYYNTSELVTPLVLSSPFIIMFFNLRLQDHDHLPTHPLFCFSVASHALLIIYFPHLFFSPLFFFFALASLFLSTNLSRHIDFGGLIPTQLPHNRSDHAVDMETANAETDAIIGTQASSEDIREHDACELIDRTCIAKADGQELAEAVQSRSVFHSSGCSFVDLGTKWPLDVIYEDHYEGEAEDDEEEEAATIIEWRPRSFNVNYRSCINKKGSARVQDFEEWRLCLPESDDDTGSSSSSELGEYDYPPELLAWESLEKDHVGMLLMWKDEKEEEEMIEIRFEGKSMTEEESLIEIDLS